MGPCGKYLTRGALASLWIVLHLSTYLAFDVHVSTKDTPNTVVFNASHDSVDWRYSLDKQKSDKFASKLVTVDSISGIVSLNIAPKCWYLRQNPLLVFIEAQGRDTELSRFSRTPLHVYVHGSDCYTKKRKNNVIHTHKTHQISTELSIHYNTCLEKLSHVIYLPHFIPRAVTKCAFEYRLSNTKHFIIDQITGEIRTSKEVCFSWPYYILHGKIDAVCGSDNLRTTQIPFKLMLYGRDTTKEAMSAVETSENVVMSTSKKLRSRRQTMNTPPAFPQRQYVKPVTEGQPVGYVVGTFTATDPDAGVAGELTYTLVASRDGRSQNMFTIDPLTGKVTTTIVLDRESIPVHVFHIVAVDAGRPQQQALASLQIPVEDINDHPPLFESQFYAHDIYESVSIGSTVITVRASDEDAGKNSDLRYSILNPGGVNDVFRIEEFSGSILTRLPLDREKNNFYTLNIQATDMAVVSERKTSTATVDLTILDENDNYPQFTKSSYTFDVSEDIDPNQYPIIAEIKATDEDDDLNGVVRYSIIGGNTRDTFSIGQENGQLSVTTGLDYDQIAKEYRLSVRAQDSGSPPRSNSTTVLVRVIDVNDNEPHFYGSSYHESVLENAAIGYTVMKVQAYDIDGGLNGKLIYTLIETPTHMPLEIDRASGLLTITTELDREKQDRFEFKVQAADQGDPIRSATAAITVVVRDVNDNAPIFNPKVYDEMVSEEAFPGTPVVTVTASDADEDENARVSYAITSGNIGGAFNIISQMGQGLITVARVLNFKSQSRYVLTVTARDSGGLEDEATVVVNVSDANTYRPIFQGTPYQLRIAEDTAVGSSVFKVVATDEDSGENARITYSIANNEAFQINPNTGDVSVKAHLDREAVPGYTLSVTATDHGRPSQSDTIDMEIVILDVNDNFPKFLESVYNGEEYEDSFIGTSILTISATDEDAGLNGHVRYTFEGGNSGDGDFSLDPTLGIVRIAKELDHERISQYELLAYAVDRGVPEKSTSVKINIKLIDVNDNAPNFESDAINATIPENSPIGSSIDPPLFAVDPDTGIDSIVKYSIVGGPDFDKFALESIDNEPAVLTTLTELDYESGKNVYKVQVRAGSFPLFTDITVTIYVTDVNDNIPELEDFVIIFNNFLNHFPTGPIGRIPATDLDVLDVLRYRILSGNQANLLHLSEDTGELKLDSRLNSDVPTNGTLQVEVTDGINPVRATCRLFVRLVTEDMLLNSLTIRLSGLEQHDFLASPLYSLFLRSLAGVVPTTEDNIFIINVQDDWEVLHERILNVSFSVRERVDEGNRDVFHSPQYLQERVYLQRTLLNKLSTLQVLPFDDNLCVREPCLNFEECLTILKFGNASSFIHSSTMLFRPIHPINAFRCQCPEGFTGMEAEYMCDTEVNLCYSSPCGHNGTCVRHEGGYTCHCKSGYTGPQCEHELLHTKSCPSGDDVCKPPSRCSTLIRGGFRCEVCPSMPPPSDSSSTDADDNESVRDVCVACEEMEYFTPFCELTTRSFPRHSFLMFPSLKRRHRFTISLQFATRARDALLLYNGRYNEQHDFIALEIIDGQVHFSFSLGTSKSRVSARVPGINGVSDGKWQYVKVDYLNKTVTLTVGEWCDPELAIKFGRQIGNYSCAARTTQFLEPKCADVTATCHRFLDLTGPLQLGGLPFLPGTAFPVHSTDFEGCMRHVEVDQKRIDLNDYAWNNGTEKGCAKKESFCDGSGGNPCQHGGTCSEGWGTYWCECRQGRGGKDCSQAIESRRRLSGSGYLLYTNHGVPNVLPVWYMGLSFRTRSVSTSTLMSVKLQDYTIEIQLVDGLLYYIHPDKMIVVENIKVNDGKWHYFETRLLKTNQLIITLDYGQIQLSSMMSIDMSGQKVGDIMVGGEVEKVGGSTVVHNGFVGCIENVRVGNNPNSILTVPEFYGAEEGCASTSGDCDTSPCPSMAQCIDDWDQHTCNCTKGRVGPTCKKICDEYNPCAPGSVCRPSSASQRGYVCQCGENQAGEYCDRPKQQTCPATWWGHPICGPCNCPVHRGFNPSCNKTTGACTCKENYYQPEGSDECLPCECYMEGSWGQQCAITGKCNCRSGVIGRRCDACSSRFAEVTIRGCEVIYDSCPRSPSGGIMWPRTEFGTVAVENCPLGTIGDATRNCTEEGWEVPKMFTCTSVQFASLKKQMEAIESSTDPLHINTFLAKKLAAELNEATREVEPNMYGMDVYVTYRLVSHVLSYENAQTGLNLTHSQDKNFIHNLVSAVGRITSLAYRHWWQEIHASGSRGAVELLSSLEEYTNTLAHNMDQLFTTPFDQVHENIVLGLDYLEKSNRTNLPVPKYNNKVQNAEMTDKSTHATIPLAVLKERSMKDMVDEIVGHKPIAAMVGYVMFNTLGELLPVNLDENTIRVVPGVPQVINTPLMSLQLVDNGKSLHTLSQPVQLHLRELSVANRTGAQCVYWKHDEASGSGSWSSEGCTLVSRLEDTCQGNSCRIVTCECTHLTTFGVIMDVSAVELGLSSVLKLEYVTYAGLGVAAILLLVALVLFCCLRRLQANSNSIHMNLVFALLIANLLFLCGINRVEPHIACTIIAIFLHFFTLCTFAWLFVEVLHLYRQLSEIRNINHGAMKFYYVLGYVLPGIIVGLAVGLHTDAYGNSRFCWVSTHELLIWSLAGPVMIVLAANGILLSLSLRELCRRQSDKAEDPDASRLKATLVAAIFLIPVMALAGAFAVLSSNEDVPAFHYLFAVFTVFEALFILLAYVLFSKSTRLELRYVWGKMRGHKTLDDSISGPSRCSGAASRSALAYHHNDSSLEGGLNRIHVGVSTNSTTSRSTDKSGNGIYRPDGYLQHSKSSSSTSNNLAYGPSGAGIPAYGFDASPYHENPAAMHQKTSSKDNLDGPDKYSRRPKARRDSDSDSELSAMEHPDLDLASSHSSDDDDDQYPGWGKFKKGKGEKHVAPPPQNPSSPPPIPPAPAQHTPSKYPPPYLAVPNPRSLHDPRTEGATMQQIYPRNVRITDSPQMQDRHQHHQQQQQQQQQQPQRHRHGSSQSPPPVANGAAVKGGSRDVLVPPERSDSLPSSTKSSKADPMSPRSQRDRIAVKVLTHNGSITSDSESTSTSGSSWDSH